MGKSLNQFTKTYLIILALFLSGAGCTGQLPGSFRYAQANQTFTANQGFDSKVDILWVVDNSASMDVSQKTLRNGFSAFATKYLQPTWDIQVAAITTDTYLAHPDFSSYLSSTIMPAGSTSSYYGGVASNPPGGTESAVSPYVGSFSDPSYSNWVAGTISAAGHFLNKLSVNQVYPSWGPDWGLLLPGNHDGPMTSLCIEANSYFFGGSPNALFETMEVIVVRVTVSVLRVAKAAPLNV